MKRRKQVVLDRGDTLQPFILAVGNDVQNLKEIFVYIDGMKYCMDSPLQALDVCFKSFLALNAQYPKTGQQIWNFIQKYIYNIHTDVDVESSSQEEVTAELCIEEPALKFVFILLIVLLIKYFILIKS